MNVILEEKERSMRASTANDAYPYPPDSKLEPPFLKGESSIDKAGSHMNPEDLVGGIGSEGEGSAHPFTSNAAAILDSMNNQGGRRDDHRSSRIEDQVREVDSFGVYQMDHTYEILEGEQRHKETAEGNRQQNDEQMLQNMMERPKRPEHIEGNEEAVLLQMQGDIDVSGKDDAIF